MTRLALLMRLSRRARMRGSILLPAAVAVGVSLVLLASADIGYVFYLKRELQKSADMAAVAGAQRIDVDATGPTCSAAVQEAAKDVAARNLDPVGVSGHVATLRCGTWDQTGAGLVPPGELADPGAPADWRWKPSGDVNAVWVRLDLTAPRLMPFVPLARNIMAHAVAVQDAPVAAFSVGLTIASLKPNSPLPVLLRELGVDVPQADIVGPSGIASVAAVLKVLGIPISTDLSVGQIEALLTAKQVTVGQLLDATLAVAEQNNVARAGLDVLNGLRGLAVGNSPGLRVQDLAVKLLGAEGQRGLLNVVGGGQLSGSALFTNVNLGELAATAISVAAIDAPSTVMRTPSALAADVGLLSLIKTKAKVIEPPAIGIGGKGTSAHNAQVRAFVHIDASQIISPSLVTLDLPVHLEVGGAQATISKIDCAVSPPLVEFDVKPALARACITTIPESEIFSRTWACPTLSADDGPSVLSLLGLTLLKQGAFKPISVIDATQPLTFRTPLEDLPESKFVTLEVNLGSMVQSVLGNVWRGVHTIFSPGGNDGSGVDKAALGMAKNYLDGSRNSQGAYDLERTITTLTQGRGSLQAVGRWTAKEGVPRACGLLLLATCWDDGDVWEGFRRSVTGQGQGIVGGLLGTLLGGLVIDNCYGLLSLRREECMQRNLASYLQTRPGGFAETAPQTGAWRPETCGASLLCRLLSGVVAPLVKPLDLLGAALTSLTSDVVGLDLGRTEVQLMSVSCHNARLVY